MLTRFEKRKQTADMLARDILRKYGGDAESARDRVLSYCNGQRWLERMVLRAMEYLTPSVVDKGRLAVKRKVLQERQDRRLSRAA